MKRVIAAIGAVGIGAGLMYLFDPDRGSRRRNQLREKTQSRLRHARKAIDGTAHGLANRARGIVADVRSELNFSPIPDVVLEERVRAALGHAVPHAVIRTLQVNAENNRVTLSGRAPASLVNRIIDEAERVHGVVGVNNLLDPAQELDQENSANPGSQIETTNEILEGVKWPLAIMMLGVAGAAATYYVQRQAERSSGDWSNVEPYEPSIRSTDRILDLSAVPEFMHRG